MKIHEYQARNILQEHDVPVPVAEVASSQEEAKKIAEEIGGKVWAVKAQVHAGGRGKAGGVKLARSLDELGSLSKMLLGSRLVTKQTGPTGAPVSKVLVQQGLDISQEFYVGYLIDRKEQKPVLICSGEGGMEIEKVAAQFPEKIIKTLIDPQDGLTFPQAEEVAVKLGVEPALCSQCAEVLMRLWNTFEQMDCSLLEINPLIVTADRHIYPLDVKMSFDDNALLRHPELEELHDPEQEDPTELQAHKAGLQYIQLNGNIACLVNGAGLAMATMDAIKLFGGEPDNFLDIGGGASPEKVTAAFEIMLAQPEVKVILVNIFGGIMKCDTIAQGIVEACRHVKLTVPLIVRMNGTHEKEGKQILKQSGLPIISVNSLGEAAQKAVELAGESR